MRYSFLIPTQRNPAIALANFSGHAFGTSLSTLVQLVPLANALNSRSTHLWHLSRVLPRSLACHRTPHSVQASQRFGRRSDKNLLASAPWPGHVLNSNVPRLMPTATTTRPRETKCECPVLPHFPRSLAITIPGRRCLGRRPSCEVVLGSRG